MEYLILLVFWSVPVVLGYVFGRAAESRHYRSIHAREKAQLQMPATSLKTLLRGADVARSELVTGSVVISIDYFKKAASALRSLVGGPVKSYETLLDRAKREAILRMKEGCPGADEIINIRLETMPLAGSQRGQVTSVEVLAYGTAIYYVKHEVPIGAA
ncbi:YbjQ family protein [Massilia sp. MS-15]|uniref:YbjQ family protein n=1 Tax=Massilia sp. MS-15 TaxID=2878200 RepID=UPI001CD54A1F|nr:heavy metal-binding domain-containing protein [Massilia sp. MS-15]MCA1248812.1 YbjQ family protein [Massilia sp. MS-15]